MKAFCPLVHVALVGLLCLAAASCGQTGALYLPEQAASSPTAGGEQPSSEPAAEDTPDQ